MCENTIEKTRPAISILIPVYKVEPFLQRCIDSVLSQDFQDWEMILVDDGSPDRCGEICDENAEKDSRIKVLHKKNEGLPAARKSGFELSKGAYIVHLDSDDYLLPGALSVLYNKAVSGNYDIVKGCNRRFTTDEAFEIEAPSICDVDILGPENYLKALIRYDIKPYIWGGIYKRELFEDCDYCFTSDVSICEDWITNQAIWKKVNKYIALSEVVCAYYINPNSMMQSKVLSHQYIDHVGGVMREIAKNAPKDILHLIDLDRTASHIRAFFIPELPWDGNVYNQLRKYIDKDACLDELTPHIDLRFLKFVGHRFCFRLYSRTYAYLFKCLKLKGSKRVVL